MNSLRRPDPLLIVVYIAAVVSAGLVFSRRQNSALRRLRKRKNGDTKHEPTPAGN